MKISLFTKFAKQLISLILVSVFLLNYSQGR